MNRESYYLECNNDVASNQPRAILLSVEIYLLMK